MSEPAIPTSDRDFPIPFRIGVLADTHIFPGSRRTLSPEVGDLFRRFECNLIAHAGDCNTIETLRELATIARVLAVSGNNDDADLQQLLPREIEFAVGHWRCALIHGHGGASARAVAAERFAGSADFVIYGHSHIPKVERIDGTVLFNPGSPTDRRWHEYFGLGVITFAADRISPELILFKDPRELRSVRPD